MAWNRHSKQKRFAVMYLHIEEGDRPSPPTSTVLITESRRERKTAGSRPPVTYLPSCRRQEDIKDSQTVRVVTRQRSAGVLNRELDVHTHTLGYIIHFTWQMEMKTLPGSTAVQKEEKEHRQKKLY